MTNDCVNCTQQFEISDEDKKFYEKISPVFDGKKYSIPEPIECPYCRHIHRMHYRNFRSLHTKESCFTKKPIISMYAPDSAYSVCTNKEWWSDQWDAIEYGVDYDPERSFFEQFNEMNLKVPRPALNHYQSENSDYCNSSFKSKNCYLVFGCVDNEDCQYGHIVWHSKNCIDGLYLYNCEYCYGSIDCVECYQTHFSTECNSSHDLYFCHDCRGCNKCFGCVGLRHKEYCLFNEQLSKEDYQTKLNSYLPLNSEKIAAVSNRQAKLRKTAIYPEIFGHHNENVNGNHIYFSKNCKICFDAKHCEDSKFIFTGDYFKDSYDASFSAGKSELIYNCLTLVNCNHMIGCHWVQDSNDMFYCDYCVRCHDCFGCANLQHKKYCILNKQYTKEEYERLVPQIIERMQQAGEWGQFFPIKYSPFAYNEAVVNEYYPMNKAEALEKGYEWSDYQNPEPKVEKVITKDEIPQNIELVSDDILKWAIRCEESGKLFRIQPAELEFYRKMKIPLPTKHHDIRHQERMVLRNKRRLWERTCGNCQKSIETSFKVEEIVYCEECYLKEVY